VPLLIETGRPVLICGTRSFAEEIADVVSDTPGWSVSGFVENLDRSRCAEPLRGLPVHWIDALEELASTHFAVCALGTTKRRTFTKQVEDLGFRFATIVHPTAHVSRLAELGDGSIASVGVVVAVESRLGRHVVLNRAALVGHHTTVGDHVSIMAGATWPATAAWVPALSSESERSCSTTSSSAPTPSWPPARS
jgi:acetyltransferase EpsM